MHILRHDFKHTYTQDFFNPTATQSIRNQDNSRREMSIGSNQQSAGACRSIRGGNRGWSGCRCWGLKEPSLSEVAYDERHGHQSDADPDRSEELVNGVGQDERAGPRCHFRPNDCLAEAQLAEQGRHIDPTGETDDTENWSEARGSRTSGHRSLSSSISLVFIDNIHKHAAHTSPLVCLR